MYLKKIFFKKNKNSDNELSFWGYFIAVFVFCAVIGLVLFGLSKIARANSIIVYEQNFEELDEGYWSPQDGWQYIEGDVYPMIVDGAYFYGREPKKAGSICGSQQNNFSKIKKTFNRSLKSGSISYITYGYGFSHSNFIQFLNENDEILFQHSYDKNTAGHSINGVVFAYTTYTPVFYFEFSDNLVRGRMEDGQWSNWIPFLRAGEVKKMLINYNRPYSDTYGNICVNIDDILITSEFLPEFEFLYPTDLQSLNDFTHWVINCEFCPPDKKIKIKINYQKGTIIKYEDFGEHIDEIGGNFAIYVSKKNSLTKGVWSATAFIEIENLKFETDLIFFNITEVLPIYSSPSPKFDGWGINEEYIIADYAENVPAIFGTTTPYNFYFSITKTFSNFFQPFADFIISIKNRLAAINNEGYGSSTAYLIYSISSINEIFNFPLISVILVYILFILSFFIFKFIIKLIRG